MSPGYLERQAHRIEIELFIDNLLVRIHFIIVMIRLTGLAPWEFEFTFPGSLTSTFQGPLKSAWYVTKLAPIKALKLIS